MKVLLIHGEDSGASYSKYKETLDSVQSKGWEIEMVEAGKYSLAERLSVNSLFVNKKIYVCDGNINTADIAWADKNIANDDIFILIYHPNVLSVTFTSKLPKSTTVHKYDYPKYIYQFLDSFYPGNSETCVKLFHQSIENQPVEMIFFLLARQVRDIYWVKNGATSADMPSWKLGKLKAQASKFKGDLLDEIINSLSEIDIKAKTSKGDLTQMLDFVIVVKLK